MSIILIIEEEDEEKEEEEGEEEEEEREEEEEKKKKIFSMGLNDKPLTLESEDSDLNPHSACRLQPLLYHIPCKHSSAS